MDQELKRRAGISRRRFLRAGAVGATGLALGLRTLGCGEQAPEAPGAPAPPTHAAPAVYDDWRDIYSERWRWDKVVRSSHWVNCWYQAHCAWNVYVKDGMVWREEQVADYPQIRPDVPDFNPRGCQKGACFSERMYDPSRIRYPLRRVGERGSGRWKRISWDEALEAVADSMLDTISQEGPERVIWDLGPLYTMGTMSAAHQALSFLLDSTSLDMNTEIGDGHRGTAETFGKIVFERSADDYFFSDLILIWGSNPLYTQIPNAHFLTEARYHGAQLVCITPDFSASSVHADLHVPVAPGCDAALALAIAHVLIAEDLVDRDFVVEQTDLPLLVRDDTRLFLRASDMERGGSDERLYLHDAQRGVVQTPVKSLSLDGLQPSLDGRFEVTLADGAKVGVRTVFSLLAERLADYTPEKASKLCGTPAGLIRELAHRIGRAKSAAMVTTSNLSKYYHGNLMERGQALVFALSGNFGKKGSGFVGFPFLTHDGFEKFLLSMFTLGDMLQPSMVKTMASTLLEQMRLRSQGYSEEMLVYERSRFAYETGLMASGALFWYVHGGLLEASEKLQEWDPFLQRPVREVLDESLSKDWQSVWPRPGDDPRVLFVYGSNPLRRIRSYPLLLKHLWPKLRTIITLDWRMTTTALQSDYVLPVAGWYERTEHKWATPLMPFIHAGEKVTTFYEAKSDWEIISRLAETIDRRAKQHGVESYVDRRGEVRPLDNLYEKFSQRGEYGHTDDDKVAEALLANAGNLEGVDWQELKKKGWARFSSIGESATSIGTMAEIRPDDTITPLTRHVFDKVPYPTLSRRIQFYLDQELYLEMGEELPVHKAPPMAGGDYPLMLTGGHTRWSIHSNWRDDKLMLQQQRGEPVMFMNEADAGRRGIADGVQTRVYNDLDWFQIMAKVSPSVRPGQLIIYHAWDNFQFKDGRGFQNLIPSPLNPVELAGGQYHFRPMVICMQPSHTDRDTRVDVELA